MNTSKILKKYKTIPKCNLLNDITPLQNLDKIARQFGLQNLYVKRDDHTNFLGGEEVRFYEYILPYIKSNGYNSILNVNDYHSNDGIVGSMISKKYDLDYFLIIFPEDPVRTYIESERFVLLLRCSEGINTIFMDYTPLVIDKISTRGE